MNKAKLRAKMIEYGDTFESLAKFLSISVGTLSKKINERSAAGFTQPEKRYSLSAEQINSIFFNK